MVTTKCIERSALAAALLCALAFPRVAHAQNAEAAALFKLGRQLVDQGKWAEACPKFETAFKLDPSARGALLNSADCHEHVGQIARAWGEWNMLGDLARKASDDARATEAKKHADDLEPRLPKLRVGVAGSQPDLSVWRDDEELKSAEYNLELPIDPGMHTISVKRGDAKLESENVDTKEKAHASVSFDLDKIAKDHPAPKDTAAGGGKVVQTNTVVVNQAGQQSTPTVKVLGNVLLGLGLTSLVVGGAFEGIAFALKGSASCAPSTDLPNTQMCPPGTISSLGAASTLADAGLGAMIGGGTFVAIAIVMYIVAPKQKEAPPTTQVGFAPMPGGASFMLRGAF